jgi:hypothetical protein
MDESLIQYGQENFNLPHDVVKLPSEGKFYKNKKKSVKVGYLTAADENIIMASSGNDIIGTLVRAKLYEPDLKPDEMLNGDIEAILIFLRNTSFGPEYNVQITDPQTGKKFGDVLRLDELDFRKPSIEPNDDGTFEVKLPKSGVNVKLRPLFYNEYQEISKNAEQYPKGRVAPRVTWRLQKQIVEVDGNQDKGEIAKFIEQMPIMDSKFIRSFMDENEPRLNMNRVVTTPSGDRLTVNVGFGVEFFRPFF